MVGGQGERMIPDIETRIEMQSGKKPRGKRRKPFSVECRMVRFGRKDPREDAFGEWGVWKRYDTREQQAQALETLSTKWRSRRWIEFRIGES